jgi:hypothetical protein
MALHTTKRTGLYLSSVVAVALMTAGCPSIDDQTAYEFGYALGFAMDEWYWDGYWDGYDTLDATPFYYDDSEIPFLETPPYDAGYWDGVWYAYNDGYFVDYHYAFIIGFSEGYDNAYWPDYLDFLATDFHSELLNGGWGDGYEDGFSEGRIFGAYDYEAGLPFDWLDALYDYESGTDLYFVEVDLGTGVYGPVILYEYGTHPASIKAKPDRTPPNRAGTLAIRNKDGAKAAKQSSADLYRAFTAEAQQELEVLPGTSLRSDRELMLDTTWFERVQLYVSDLKEDAEPSQTPRAE